MNTLLIFFAFPIAVIIISAILQKLLDNPFAVAALIFAIFLVVTFAAFDETFLIATLAYTILAFITALLVSRLHDLNNRDTTLCNALEQILQATGNDPALLQNLLSTNTTMNASRNNNAFNNNTNSNNSNSNNSIDNSFNNNTNSNNFSNTITNPDDDDNVLINNCNCGRRRIRHF